MILPTANPGLYVCVILLLLTLAQQIGYMFSLYDESRTLPNADIPHARTKRFMEFIMFCLITVIVYYATTIHLTLWSWCFMSGAGLALLLWFALWLHTKPTKLIHFLRIGMIGLFSLMAFGIFALPLVSYFINYGQ